MRSAIEGRSARRRVPSVVLGATLFCAAAASTSPARAEDPAKALGLAQAAAARAEQGDRRGAIALYEEAYAADPRNAYTCHIARHFEALAAAGDSRDIRLAIGHYERCLGGEGPSEQRADIEARLARLRAQRAKTPPPPEVRALRPGSEDAPPGTTEEPMRVHSPALAIGGFVFIALGAVQVLAGTIMLTQASEENFGYIFAGAPLLAHGVACAAAGIPMVVVGRRMIPASGIPSLAPLVVPPPPGAPPHAAGRPLGLSLLGTF